jgi:hypothetical protein
MVLTDRERLLRVASGHAGYVEDYEEVSRTRTCVGKFDTQNSTHHAVLLCIAALDRC